MSYYNQQQPPVGVPPPQGYPPEGYPKDAYPPPGYPPQGYPQQGYPAQGYPPPPPYAPQYAQPPPQQNNSSSGCLEGWVLTLAAVSLTLAAVSFRVLTSTAVLTPLGPPLVGRTRGSECPQGRVPILPIKPPEPNQSLIFRLKNVGAVSQAAGLRFSGFLQTPHASRPILLAWFPSQGSLVAVDSCLGVLRWAPGFGHVSRRAALLLYQGYQFQRVFRSFSC